MIYHLSVAGTPVTWTIAAIYDDCAGVARKSAENWRDKQNTHQCVIKIASNGDTMLAIFLGEAEHQYPHDHPMYLNGFRKEGGIQIDAAIRDRIETVLRKSLLEQEIFIPRKLWEKRYPASKLMDERTSEFLSAMNALGEGEDLPFEDRWASFMDPPRDFVPSFKLASSDQGYFLQPNREGVEDPTDRTTWKDKDTALFALRLLNSGWSWDDTQTLMFNEPVDA